ncbi:hypothetical protein [Rugamonas rubra]|uniref:hypothetical protein n=1 Tax=Rugamonas rubra TaxID=758825 RepID=UPI001113E495|nr:hypothetical protein [Rugamonas rubra]
MKATMPIETTTGGTPIACQSIVPNQRASVCLVQNIANMSNGAVSGILGSATGEMAPGLVGVPAMTLQLAIAAGAAAFRRAVRGDEAGRAATEQRIRGLQDGGVEKEKQV